MSTRSRSSERPLPLATIPGLFASLDPRVDGVEAPLGSIWIADDCPLRMQRVGASNTAWAIEGPGEAVLATCRTAAEVNALYAGLARQPGLDFTPSNILVPDPDNDRLTDVVAGHHLTRQGIGAGAVIERSSLGDGLSPAGWQAAQSGGNASYYAATSSAHYDVGEGAFVVGYLMSCTRTAQGGIMIGKYADPGLAGDGWGMSTNAGGRFGFLQNGDLGDLNLDDYGAVRIDDGRPRLFHLGRSVKDTGFGFVRTAGIPPVSVNGNAGDLTPNVEAVFGLHSDSGGGGRLAAGDHQFQAIVFWTGRAAENVIAYLDEIERSLASATITQSSAPIHDPVASTPVRVLGAAFRPNALRPTWASYTIEYGSGGQTTAYVALKADAFNPPTTVRARTGGGIGVAIVTIHTGQISFLVPAGWYVMLEQVDVAAGGTCTIREQVEVEL